MNRFWGGLALGLGGLSIACGSGSGGPANGGTGGQNTAGTAATSGASGNTAGAGGGSSGAGGAGVTSVTPASQPTCDATSFACNGQCLKPGESMGSCEFLFKLEASSLLANAGDIYASGLLPDTSAPNSPAPGKGLFRIAGSSFAVTTLDPATEHASALAIEGSTVYYLSPVSDAPGSLRSVGTDGSNPKTLVDGIGETTELVVVGDNLYFGAALAAASSIPTVNSVPVAGGAAVQTPLGSSRHLRANATLLVSSFNGDINLGAFPATSALPQLMPSGALPYDSWWIDDTYVYWQKAQTYKRHAFSAGPSTEAQGEVVTTLPGGMQGFQDAVGELVIVNANDPVGHDGVATGVYIMPLAGGTPTLLATVADVIDNATADADYVYVVTRYESALLRIKR